MNFFYQTEITPISLFRKLLLPFLNTLCSSCVGGIWRDCTMLKNPDSSARWPESQTLSLPLISFVTEWVTRLSGPWFPHQCSGDTGCGDSVREGLT